MKLKILSTIESPRFQYVLSEVQRRLSDIDILLQHPTLYQPDVESCVLLYGVEDQEIEGYISCPMNKYIQPDEKCTVKHSKGKGIDARLFVCESWQSNTQMFFDFDVFSAIFFLLSRHEEYYCEVHERHDRFEGTMSWMFGVDAIAYPLVDVWCHAVRQMVYTFFKTQTPKPQANVCLTFDVDIPWALKNVNIMRKVFRKLKYLVTSKPQFTKSDINQNDPYDTFHAILKELRENNTPQLWFWLLSTKSKFDALTPYTHPDWQALFYMVAQESKCGVHPSYHSSMSRKILESEVKEFVQLYQRSAPLRSRQHYLRYTIPTTLRWLQKVGVEHEYSMGFHDIAGYRAGTSYPFQWYDVENEEIAHLLIHPLHMMDVTLKNYSGMNAHMARKKVCHFGEMTKKYGGELIILWHNSFFTHTEDIEEWWRLFTYTCKLNEKFQQS